MNPPERSRVATRPRAPQPPGPARRGGLTRVRRFTRRYGWRAYALPVLVVVSVVALMTAGRSATTSSSPGTHKPASGGGAPGGSVPPTAAGDAQLKTDKPGAGSQNSALAADALPAGSPYTVRGAGTFRVLPGSSRVVGRGPLHRYTVEVENGITGVDLTGFATLVDRTLDDPRSWSGHGLSVQRVSSGGDFAITLTSSMTVRSLCGYDIPIETSCWAPDANRVVLNVARWVRGDPAYIGDLAAYRVYMVNHEDGHALGHMHAHACLPGGLAPVMMQQTIGLKSTTGQLCQANPWPYPIGARGAPGKEEPDTPQNSQITLQNS